MRPKFHIKDLTCDENDPNFPFYDEVHGMYHLMYQDHLCIAPGFGPDIGHVVSRDFVHWTHLPVSIWNDKPYDEVAIFTGSATVVDGKPFIVYPGLCTKGGDFEGCITGTNYAQAVPADASDPACLPSSFGSSIEVGSVAVGSALLPGCGLATA